MTQQPYQQQYQAPQQGGFPPAQQPAPQGQFPQQGGFPPAQQPAPQGQFPQQGGFPPAQQPAPQAPTNQNDSGGFFGGMGGGDGEVIPSFKFGGVNSVVQGQVLSCAAMGVSDYTTGETVLDAKTGEEAKQLKIVLQTQHRNWEHVAKVPTDDDGNPLPPTADDGRRAIYTGGKSSRGQSWMSGAINDALRAANRDPSKGIEIGATLGVVVTEEVPSGKGNPYKKYGAKYASPSQGGFAPQQQQAPAPQQPAPAPQQPAATYSPVQAEATGNGWGQQPQQQEQQPQQAPAAPPQGQDPWAGGYQPPAQPAPQPQGPAASNPWAGANEGTPPF